MRDRDVDSARVVIFLFWLLVIAAMSVPLAGPKK